jgi:hypothetical protein
VAAGYSGQQEIEKIFRGLKDGDWLGGADVSLDRPQDPRPCFLLHAWHLLLQYVHKQAQTAWAGISVEHLLDELRHIEQFVLLYPPQGEKGPNRVTTVLSKQTLTQQALAKTLGLEQLHITQRG